MCKREGEKEKILFLGLDKLIYIAGAYRNPAHQVVLKMFPSTNSFAFSCNPYPTLLRTYEAFNRYSIVGSMPSRPFFHASVNYPNKAQGAPSRESLKIV
jgi:hypothetical protein